MTRVERIINVTLLLALSFPFFGYGQAYISSLSNLQIDSLLMAYSKKELTVCERMNQLSGMFMDMPYSWTATGEGPEALYEPYPLVNFDSTNCMVYCEHVLAMSISDSWDNFFNNLQQIRYQNGIIGMRTRNHYTLGDWLPENSWLLDNVSREVAGEETQSVSRTISHNQFFRKKGIADLRYIKEDYTPTVDFIPGNIVCSVEKKIKNGDIGVLIFSRKDDIFAAHMVMFVLKEGKLRVREASSKQNKVIERPFKDWSNQLAQNKYRAGIALLRVNKSINKPDMVVLPWEIAALRSR